MIVLDTNVLSGITKPQPSPLLIRWLASQERAAMFTTAITQAGMLYGLERLPEGKRKQSLILAVDGMFAEDFEGRVLNFDPPSATAYARLHHQRKMLGSTISQSDTMIAAIAISIGAAIVTRNTKDFADCGIQVINPW